MDTATDTKSPMSREQIAAYLDEYRAGESTGAKLFRGWAASCKHESLRGALRVMELREQSHADLLERRLRELGGTPKHEVGAMEFVNYLASPTHTDAMKLREFARNAPVDMVLGRLNSYADRMDGDPETQSLMRAIIEDERATLCCLDGFAKTLIP